MVEPDKPLLLRTDALVEKSWDNNSSRSTTCRHFSFLEKTKHYLQTGIKILTTTNYWKHKFSEKQQWNLVLTFFYQ